MYEKGTFYVRSEKKVCSDSQWKAVVVAKQLQGTGFSCT